MSEKIYDKIMLDGKICPRMSQDNRLRLLTIIQKHYETHQLPSKVSEAYSKSSDFSGFRKRLGVEKYEYDLYIVGQKQGKEKMTTVEKKELPFLAKIINDTTGRTGFTFFPKERVSIFKEKYESNPCTEGALLIKNIIELNREKTQGYNTAIAEYDKNYSDWRDGLYEAQSKAKTIAGYKYYTGYVNPIVLNSAIVSKCLSVNKDKFNYGQELQYNGVAYRDGLKYTYQCSVANKDEVISNYVAKWALNNPTPIKPSQPILETVPQFICQNCPNTVSMDSSNLEESLLELANNCSISTETTTTTNTTTENTTNETTNEAKPTSKPAKDIVSEKKWYELIWVWIALIVILVIALLVRIIYKMNQKISYDTLNT